MKRRESRGRIVFWVLQHSTKGSENTRLLCALSGQASGEWHIGTTKIGDDHKIDWRCITLGHPNAETETAAP